MQVLETVFSFLAIGTRGRETKQATTHLSIPNIWRHPYHFFIDSFREGKKWNRTWEIKVWNSLNFTWCDKMNRSSVFGHCVHVKFIHCPPSMHQVERALNGHWFYSLSSFFSPDDDDDDEKKMETDTIVCAQINSIINGLVMHALNVWVCVGVGVDMCLLLFRIYIADDYFYPSLFVWVAFFCSILFRRVLFSEHLFQFCAPASSLWADCFLFQNKNQQPKLNMAECYKLYFQFVSRFLLLLLLCVRLTLNIFCCMGCKWW